MRDPDKPRSPWPASLMSAAGGALVAILVSWGLNAAMMPTAPAGPAGAAGDQGPQGLQGPAGADGLDGLDGADGAPGAPGIPGLRGAVGAPGATGADGAPGADGSDGADGAPGSDGAPGADGVLSFFWIRATGPAVYSGGDVIEFDYGTYHQVQSSTPEVFFDGATFTVSETGAYRLSYDITLNSVADIGPFDYSISLRLLVNGVPVNAFTSEMLVSTANVIVRDFERTGYASLVAGDQISLDIQILGGALPGATLAAPSLIIERVHD